MTAILQVIGYSTHRISISGSTNHRWLPVELPTHIHLLPLSGPNPPHHHSPSHLSFVQLCLERIHGMLRILRDWISELTDILAQVSLPLSTDTTYRCPIPIWSPKASDIGIFFKLLTYRVTHSLLQSLSTMCKLR